MNYKKGHQTKPLRQDDGIVIFTDGANDVMPSESSCVAYGYKWDKANGTCVIHNNPKVNVAKTIDNGYNKILGRRNKTNGTVNNSIIAGESNVFEGKNNNVFVNGNNNLVKSGAFNSSIVSGDRNLLGNNVNNSTIISGVGAISIRDNETIVGGFYKDGLALGGVIKPFTSQTSNFNMQVTIDDSTALTPLSTESGQLFINTHLNSFVNVTASCMLTGDNLNKISVGTLTGSAAIGSNGNVALKGSQYVHGDNTVGGWGNHLFYLATDSNQRLVIKLQGKTGELVIAVASVSITEVIHDIAINL